MSHTILKFAPRRDHHDGLFFGVLLYCMDQETKSKLFGKFSRGVGGAKLNTGGSGLGLYLAKQIVEAHKGSINVDSDGEGKGSTFTLSLKIDKQA